MSDERVRLKATVSGNVQGVGFRAWVRNFARPAGLVGSATNLDDGCVEVVAEGSSVACRELLDRLRSTGTPGSVTTVDERWVAAENDLDDFVLG